MTYLLIVSLLWSFSFVIIKKSLVILDPYFVSAVRLTLSMLVFLPFLRFRGLSSRLIAKLLALGAVQFGIMYACYTASFAYLPAYMLVLLTTTTPLLVVFFDMLFSRRNVPVFWVAAFLLVLTLIPALFLPRKREVSHLLDDEGEAAPAVLMH